MEADLDELAKAMSRAWADALDAGGGIPTSSGAMPVRRLEWDDLAENVREAWRAAAREAINRLRKES